MAQLFQSFFQDIKAFVYPNNCMICNRFVENPNYSICNICFSGFMPTWLENWIDKLRFSDSIDEVYSAWYTTGAINDIIHSMKYHNQPKLGEELGRRIAEEIPIDEIGKIDLITAVPLNATRRRERGYNQSEWISKGISKAWGVPYKFNLLKRTNNTTTQTDLSISERKENMIGAFSQSHDLDYGVVAIVDDVITTGATMSACAIELKKSSIDKIIGVSCCTPDFGL